jgi:hypothetical protein
MLLKPNALRMCATSTAPNPRARSANQRLLFWPRLLATGEPTARTGIPVIRRALRAAPVPPLAPFVAEAARVIAPKFLMAPLLAQKAGPAWMTK